MITSFWSQGQMPNDLFRNNNKSDEKYIQFDISSCFILFYPITRVEKLFMVNVLIYLIKYRENSDLSVRRLLYEIIIMNGKS